MLAEVLLNSRDADDFLRTSGGRSGQEIMSELKQDMDHLVGSDLNVAARLADRIERLADHLGDPVSSALARASRARVLHSSGRHNEANALYESALGPLLEARLAGEAAAIRIHQVYALTQMGRHQEALAAARRTRRMLAADPIKLAQLETNIGNIYYMLDRYNLALKHYDRANAIFVNSGDDNLRAFVDHSRSNIFIELDRPEEAQALLERAATAWDLSGRGLLAAQSRFNAAYLEFLRGNYNAALVAYYRTRDEFAGLGDAKLVAWCNLEVAEILLALNAFDDAAASAASAQSHFSDLGMSYEAARAALVHALAATGLERFAEAHQGLTAAREVFAASGNTIFSAISDSYLAELALRRGDAGEADRRATSALRVFARGRLINRSAHARVLVARAAYQSGDHARASRMARAALSAVEGISAPGVVYRCYHILGRLDRDRGRPQAALDSFRRAVDTVEHMRGRVAADEFKATFLRDKIEVYEDAITACLDQGDDALAEEAFRLVESSKSRALADLLAHYLRGADPESAKPGLTSGARTRLAKLIEELNWYSSHAELEDDKGDERSAQAADRYRRAVLRTERQITQLLQRVEAEEPAFADIQRMKAASAADLRHTLEADETAIEYFMTGDHVSAFVVTRDSFKVARAIASKDDLAKLLASLQFQVDKFSCGRSYVDAHFWQLKRMVDLCLNRIYEAIFAPLEALISSSRLVVIPHGSLHYIPFHALCDRRGYYLIDRLEISYAPSAAVLKLCRAKPLGGRAGKMVAIGAGEDRLPGVESEIRALGEIFPDAVLLGGSEATRANLTRVAPQARFLHLASHGYFRRDNPMFSFLQLADSPLNFYNLLDLRFDAEMVTLSACHTGVNAVFPGDELHGLMRGFLYAGAPTLVVSLWAVNDRSTAELMREMYTNIRAGSNKRAALRTAQLKIKDAYGHPYYWAPFALMGRPA